MTEQNATGTQADQRQFALQRVYTKDVSFETANSPDIFREEWKPEMSVNLNSGTKLVADGVYEVVLTVTVNVKLGGKTAYLVEVQQAGIFGLVNFPEQELGQMLGSYCPNILFPYAREVVSSLVDKGSFPQLLLAPVNFDALYAQHLQELQKQQGAPN